MDFLNIKDKTFLVFGVANRKSVAYFTAKTLEEYGAKTLHVVKDDDIKKRVEKLFPESKVYTCNVENDSEIATLFNEVKGDCDNLNGIVHSIAFANFSEGLKPFHETNKADFLQAVDISAFSLIKIANHFKTILDENASVVTISISTTRMAAESYGYMGPIKAALDSAICFLAKSFSEFSNVRFNAVGAGLLKTSASAGIPGYIDYYLYSEDLTLRKRSLATQEVADTAVYLLSERSSGINSQKVVIDAGMGTNYFDKSVMKKAMGKDKD